MKIVKENMLQSLSFLALKMENSGIEFIEAIAPGALVQLDSALTKDDCRISEKQSTETDIKDIRWRVEKTAKFLDITTRETILIIAANLSRK